MDALIVVGATSALALGLIALYVVVGLLDRIPAIHSRIEEWMPERDQ